VKFATAVFILCFGFFFATLGYAELSAPLPAGELQRAIKVRAFEVFDKRKLRLYVVVDEFDSEGRYLLNTLDARSFRLFAKENDESPVDAISLSTIATKSPPVLRETAIAFESNSFFSQLQNESIRKSVASFLGGFRSDVLSVRMGNEDSNTRLAWISPNQSENPRAMQRAVLDAPVSKGRRGLTPVVCSAVRDINVVTPQGDIQNVQRNVIIISSDMSGADHQFSEMSKCLGQALDLGVRIFWIKIHSPAEPDGLPSSKSRFEKSLMSAVIKSGGFMTRVASSLDPTAALNNVRSYLDDEYILEFDLTGLKPYSKDIELELTASYHGNVIKGDVIRASGFTPFPTPAELARTRQLREAAKNKELVILASISVILALSGIFVWLYLKKKAHVCRDCTYVVSRHYQDCPFRNEKCYGRLSILQGAIIGNYFPLFSGDNLIGSDRSSTVRLKGKEIFRQHAKIVISKRKALFMPLNGSQCRVNGIIATEPRLIGSGSVIRMGDIVCRVDFKEVQ